MSDSDHLGPVEYVALEFPDGNVTAEGFRELMTQVQAGTIYVLDVEFLSKSAKGGLTKVPAGDLGPELADYVGADAGLLDEYDMETVGADLAVGSVMVVIVYEYLTLNAAISAWEAGGARLVAEGPVSVEDLEEALANEPHEQEA